MHHHEPTNPLYYLVESSRLQFSPARFMLLSTQQVLENENHPFYHTPLMQVLRASVEITERITRTYAKPEFGIESTVVDHKQHDIVQKTVIKKTFCNLLHFQKSKFTSTQPKLLIVAPMAGHHATLLRGTVEGLLPHCDLYITDWIDAAQVPLSDGAFDMDDYINYVIEFLQHLGPDVHVMAVCQPTVPVLAAISIMSAKKDPKTPQSMILMGGPVDARKNPTSVNHVATTHDIQWFQDYLISSVPANYPGFARKVYPGFLQLSGFIGMNWKNHVSSHIDLFKHLVVEEDDKAEKQKEFYDEYLSVMDLPAEFYLQTIQEVFQKYSLAKDKLVSRGRKVDPSDITNVALLGIEGENDDISGVGQTKAALSMCDRIPDSHKQYYLQKGVGHYGVFSGSKFRQFIVPVIRDFVYKWDSFKSSEKPEPKVAIKKKPERKVSKK